MTRPEVGADAVIPDGRVPDQAFCGHCGRRDGPPGDPAHDPCRTAAELEPPRYCRACGRRMVVQVNPVGWTARCLRHGEQHG